MVGGGILSYSHKIVVTDATDGNPLAGVTIIDNSGIIQGITEPSGEFTIQGYPSYPLTVRSLGYNTMEFKESEDTIALTPAEYRLNEVTVAPGERPIKRILCFAREYSTGATSHDSLQLYCEYMTETFIADGKVKGYKKSDANPKIKNVTRHAKIASAERGDSIFSPTKDDDISALSWFELTSNLSEDLTLTSAMEAGALSDTVPGKYGPKRIYSRKNGLLSIISDAMSDHKDRHWSPWFFKLLGLSVDVTYARWTTTYSEIDDERELLNQTSNFHIIGTGRLIKKFFHSETPVDFDSYLEIYPVETTYCTVEEYKELKAAPEIQFIHPENLESLGAFW